MTEIQVWGVSIGSVLVCLWPIAVHLFGNFHVDGFGDSPVSWAHEQYIVPTTVVMVGLTLLCIFLPIAFKL